MLVSTAPSPSSPAAGAQSNNSCQKYVALATISVATGEAAAPTKEQQTADGLKETPATQRSPSEPFWAAFAAFNSSNSREAEYCYFWSV